MSILHFPANRAGLPCAQCLTPTKSEAKVCFRCIRLLWMRGEAWPFPNRQQATVSYADKRGQRSKRNGD